MKLPITTLSTALAATWAYHLTREQKCVTYEATRAWDRQALRLTIACVASGTVGAVFAHGWRRRSANAAIATSIGGVAVVVAAAVLGGPEMVG